MRHRLQLAALAAIVCTGAAAQEPVDLDVIARIEAEGMERSQVGEHFNYLANVIGPRLTASPARKRAAEWAAGKLEEWGLDDVHLESWEFGRGWTLEGLTLEMTAPRYFPLVGYPEAWTPATRGMLSGRPVYIGDWTDQDLRTRASELRGRIVLVAQPQESFIVDDRPQPTTTDERVSIGAPRGQPTVTPGDRRTLATALAEAGVGAVLRPNQGQHGTIFVTGRDPGEGQGSPTVVLESEHYDMIVRALQAGEPVSLRIGVSVRYHDDDPNGYNVIAEIPGTDRRLGEQVVLVGAHLDSWHSAAGATDNADAVATVMEAMRILKTLGVRPRRTIRMALWDGEEQGLLGSREYVRRHYGDDNPANRDNLAVYLNDDPGNGPIYGWYMEENPAAKAIFDAWLEPLKDIGARKNVMDHIGSTDHVSFNQAGLPGFNTLQDYQDYDVRTHHTTADFYERVNPDDLKEAAIVMAVFMYQAAMRDQKIPRAPIS